MPTEPAPRFSVIVPFRNAGRTLDACLLGLANQTFASVECIFVNNGSTDESAIIVGRFIQNRAFKRWRLIGESRPGASAARNRGAREALGEWLAFTDADCVADPTWLSDLDSAIRETPEVAAFAGQIRAAPATTSVEKFLGLFTLPPNVSDRIWTDYSLVKGGFPFANFTVLGKTYAGLSGLDESIPIYGEDHDFCARLYAAGHQIRSLTRASIEHIHRAQVRGLFRQSAGFGRSHALLLKRRKPGALLFFAPGLRIIRPKSSFRIWIDLNQADKKTLAILLLGIAWPLLWLLLPAYLLALCANIRRTGHNRNITLSPRETPILAGLLLLKSFALGFGRITGSLRHRVCCI